MNDLTGDDIFYGAEVPRLAVEDIVDEATADPHAFAKELISYCQDDLVSHFIDPHPFDSVSFRADEEGAISYSLRSDDGERSGYIPKSEIHADNFYYALLHARSK